MRENAWGYGSQILYRQAIERGQRVFYIPANRFWYNLHRWLVGAWYLYTQFIGDLF